MSAVWNFMNPLRNGHMKLLGSGSELFGTVIRDGLNLKTCTVKVEYQFYNRKYKQWHRKSSNFQCHDEESFCKSGDKVVIKTCKKLTNTKYYFIRNVVKQFPNNQYYDQFNVVTEEQKIFNENQQAIYKELLSAELQRITIKNKKQLQQVKVQLKHKAFSKAQSNLRKEEAQIAYQEKQERIKQGIIDENDVEKQIDDEDQSSEVNTSDAFTDESSLSEESDEDWENKEKHTSDRVLSSDSEEEEEVIDTVKNNKKNTK